MYRKSSNNHISTCIYNFVHEILNKTNLIMTQFRLNIISNIFKLTRLVITFQSIYVD